MHATVGVAQLFTTVTVLLIFCTASVQPKRITTTTTTTTKATTTPIITTTTTPDDALCNAQGRPMLMPPNQTMVQCTYDMDCLPPAVCNARSRICCVQPLNQAPPPVGCPKGTRQLQKVNGEWLSCEPTRPSSCPGGALCYEDSLDGQHRCCGKDPGEGCGTGQRVLRHAINGSVQLCVPGALPECPGNAVCEWSFTIDRFQCCEPDSGCPSGEVPLFDELGEVLTCSPHQQQRHHSSSTTTTTASCPPAAQCRFNFWIADYQCCAAQQQSINPIRSSSSSFSFSSVHAMAKESRDILLSKRHCAPGEIPYIELGTTKIAQCDRDRDCPPQFHCHNQRHICCGPPGQCPREGEHPLQDQQGNVRLCLLTHPEVCPDDSKCRETLDILSGSSTGQRVCCGMLLDSYECAVAGARPFPSKEYPQVCELNNPVECPQHTICQASNVPDISICCTGADTSDDGQRRALCPKGWSAPDQLNIFCHPTIRGSCPSFAACLLSPVSQQFVCCEPGGDDGAYLVHHHHHHHLTGDGQHHHNDQAATHHRRHPNAVAPRPHVRTHHQQSARRSVSMRSLVCPNADDRVELLANGNARHCTIDGRVPCGDGFLCEQSVDDPRVGVCCSAQRTPNRQKAPRPAAATTTIMTAMVGSRGRAHDSYEDDERSDNGNNNDGGDWLSRHSSSEWSGGTPYFASAAPQALSRPPPRRVVAGAAGRDEPTYRCPSGAQVPVLRNGQNVFCDLGAQRCPSGSSCASALNAFGMMICCRNARQTLPLCPVGMQPEPSTIGYVPCDLLVPDQCSEGYQCMHSRDDPETNICCSRLRNQPPSTAPICPNQQVLLRDGARPRYCSPRQGISACPNGYQCEESLSQANVFVCCSIPALAMCPQGFVSSLDLRTQSPIRCSPMDVSMCPAEAQCLEASNRANEFLCCESTEPGRVCPVPGQAALLKPNGRPEECTGPGSPCSKSSYTCQLSHVLNRYVCCGTPAAVVLCADGRETYQQEPGRVVQCNPISWPSECPAGYECALSNRPGVHVCCRRVPVPPDPNVNPPEPPMPNTDLPPPLQTDQPLSVTFRPPVDELTCPIGWSAYEDQRGAHHFCQDALDMTCPHGFSCAQSSVGGIFMCCRLASTIQCPHEYSTLMVNNNPRLCSLTVLRRSVPATSAGGGTLPSSAPAGIVGTFSPTGASMAHTCPTGYTCMQSSVPAVYVCCGSGTTVAGSAGYGAGTGLPGAPSPAAPLVPSLPPGTSGLITTSQMGQPYCMDGQLPAYLGQLVRYCVVLGQASECPPSYVCAMSNRPGLYVCCHPFPVANRRASKAHQMRDYSAARSTTKTTKTAAQIIAAQHCPDNREPYRHPETGELRRCNCGAGAVVGDAVSDGGTPAAPPAAGDDPAAGVVQQQLLLLLPEHQCCPAPFVCKRDVADAVGDVPSRHNHQHHHNKQKQRRHRGVCCSPIAFCPEARLPLVDPGTRHAKRCLLPPPNTGTSNGGDAGGRGANALAPGDPKTAHRMMMTTNGGTDDRGDDGGYCSPPYTCQPSTVPGITVCCKPPMVPAI